MALDFYHGHGSPYSWRVWLALEAKGIPYDVKIMSFQAGDTRKPEFIAINLRHTVPTIVDDGYALWESMAILEYLDERFTQGARLYPGDAKARARIRRLIREAEEHIGVESIDPIADAYFGQGGGQVDAQVRVWDTAAAQQPPPTPRRRRARPGAGARRPTRSPSSTRRRNGRAKAPGSASRSCSTRKRCTGSWRPRRPASRRRSPWRARSTPGSPSASAR